MSEVNNIINKQPYITINQEAEIKYWKSFDDYQPSEQLNMKFDEKDIENLTHFEELVNKTSEKDDDFNKLSEIEKVVMTSNPIIFKFWIARDKNQEKALEMWKNSVKFRSQQNLRDTSLETEFNEQIKQAQSFYYGYDHSGRNVKQMITKTLNDKNWDPEHFKTFCLWQMENAWKKFAQDDIRSQDKMQIAIIHERSDKKNVSETLISKAKEIGTLAGDNWPETLGIQQLMNSNQLLAAVVNFFKGFLPKKTSDKFKMISSNEELHEDVDRNEIWVEIGGHLVFDFIYKDQISEL